MVNISPDIVELLECLDCPVPVREEWNLETLIGGIVWLEEEIVRFLDPANRKWLTEYNDWDLWVTNLREYGSKLNIHVDEERQKEEFLLQFFERLTCRGVEETYAEFVDSVPGAMESKGQPSQTLMNEEVKTLCCEILNLPSDLVEEPPTLQGAVTVLARGVAGSSKRPTKQYTTTEVARLVGSQKLLKAQKYMNEAMVHMQLVTADPKTDHRLGRVGT